MTHWHGPHLSIVERHQEARRLGSIRPLDRATNRPQEWLACGVYHRLASFWSFGEAMVYLEGRGNRAPVAAEMWPGELYGSEPHPARPVV